MLLPMINDCEKKSVRSQFDGQSSVYGTYAHYGCHGSNVQAAVEREAIIETLKRMKFSRVLDAGCGPGRYLAFVDQRCEAVGLDISSNMAHAAKRNVRGSDIVVADMEFIPFRDSSFDLLYSIRVMKYLKNQAEFLREIMRTCGEGGCVLLCDVRTSENISYLVLQTCMRIKRVFQSHRSQQPEESRRLRPSVIKRLLEQPGELRVRTRGILFLPSAMYARTSSRILLRIFAILDNLLSQFPFSQYLAFSVLFTATKRAH